MDYNIVVIDDDPDFLESIQRGLVVSGFKNISVYRDPLKAEKLFRENNTFVIALIDITMPGISGIELLDIIKTSHPHTECIILTAVNDVSVAVKCLKKGAYDYLVKPISKEDLVISINRVLEKKRLSDIVDISKSTTVPSLNNKEAFREIITGIGSIQRILKEAELHACSDLPILITGMSGTGKELLARAIHAASPRAQYRFTPINMAAISPGLFDAEFFGYSKGAFTGADSERMGYLEYSNKGTLFLDEIGTLPFELQGKLLRFLQEGEFIRLGSNKIQKADVRIITATNADLSKQVDKNLFRKDLYYRLKGGWLHLPPLKERREDIPLLVNSFMKKYCLTTYGKENCTIEDKAMFHLMNYDYPGNIRELKSIIQTTLNLSQGRYISTAFLPQNVIRRSKKKTGERHFEFGPLVSLAAAEKNYILEVYNQTGHNKTKAAKILGVAVNTLRKKIKYYEIE